MPINRHISLLENRVSLLQGLLRSKRSPELGYSCLLNVIAEGDGWSDWQDFMDHGRFAAIERNWHERTLKALDRLGIEGITIDDLKRLESQHVRQEERPREATM